MPSIAILLIYIVLLLTNSALVVLIARKKARNKLDMSMLFIATTLIGWVACEILFLVAPTLEMSRFFFDMKLPFVALVSLAWFFYVIRFYGRENYFPPVVVLCFLVVPIFTFCMAVTSPQHPYLRESIEIVQVMPTVEYTMTRGPWFWYHTVFGYGLTIASFITAIIQHFRTPASQKRPSALLLFALLLSFLANVISVFIDTHFDFSLFAASLSALIVHFSARRYQGLNFIIQTRNDAFNQIIKPMFILDEENHIVVVNKTADKWMEEENIKPKRDSFLDILSQIEAISFSKDVLEDGEAGTDYRLNSGRIFNVRYRPLLDNQQSQIGRCAYITDETKNRELIDRLDKYSGMDSLTGLSNRRQMGNDLRLYSADEHLPTSIIFGDLNGLKETNDTLGHQEGDTLLRLAAEVLKRTCPPSAKIARMGGDEYVILLPNYTAEQTEALVDEIRVELKNEEGPQGFEVSMSLGFAVKESSEQDIHETLKLADERMYEDKKIHKAKLNKSPLER